MKNVIVVTNIPTPYRVPLFNLLAKELKQRKWNFCVLFSALTYVQRQWDGTLKNARFPYRIVKTRGMTIGPEKTLFLPFGLERHLRDLKPDCVIVAGFSLDAIVVSRFCRKTKTPYLLWSGDHKHHFQNLRFRWARNMLRKRLLRTAAGAIAYGSLAREYLCSLGIPGDRAFVAINSVDTEFFSAIANARSSNVTEGKTTSLLFVAYLHERKGLQFVLRALSHMKDQDVELNVVGDGPYRQSLESQARLLCLDRVMFHGFKQQLELKAFFEQADVFVFPSIVEIFGLTLVEAAASGLPLIASKSAGATVEVVEDGLNGFTVDARDVEAWRDRILDLHRDSARRTRMGLHSSEKIKQNINLRQSVQGFIDALDACVG